MKPIIKIIYNGNGSVIEMSLKGKTFEEMVEKELLDKRYSKIVSSPIQLYITIVLNPNDNELNDSFQQNGKVHVKVSSDLIGDGDIYSLQLGLSRLKVPDGVDRILAIIDKRCLTSGSATLDCLVWYQLFGQYK